MFGGGSWREWPLGWVRALRKAVTVTPHQVVPMHGEISPGTLRGVLEQVVVTEDGSRPAL
jgi:hypothetical protein